MRETCALIDATRAKAARRLSAAGIHASESHANFLLLDLRTPQAAAQANAALQANGIFLRPQAGAGLPQYLRMTIGPPDHVDLAVTALEDWAREAKP